MTETFEIYCGRTSSEGVGGIHGLAHEGEDIRVLVVPFAEAVALLERGQIRVSHLVIALQWLALNRARVRTLWRRDAG
jgi:ADP-ribose pyrophosphatase